MKNRRQPTKSHPARRTRSAANPTSSVGVDTIVSHNRYKKVSRRRISKDKVATILSYLDYSLNHAAIICIALSLLLLPQVFLNLVQIALGDIAQSMPEIAKDFLIGVSDLVIVLRCVFIVSKDLFFPLTPIGMILNARRSINSDNL
jgi:hypothetical protein